MLSEASKWARAALKSRFPSNPSRWIYLAFAVISTMMVGLYQYSWTLFVLPLKEELGWQIPTIQLTFTLYTWVMTWTQPLAGLYTDKKGPRTLATLAALLTGLGWISSSYVSSPLTLYLAYSVGSVGVGIFYAASVGLATKWFPRKRGFATGLAVFGFGFGAALFNPIISSLIHFMGFRATFFNFGILMLIILVISSQILRYPPKVEVQNTIGLQGGKDKITVERYQFTPKEMISTRQWWLIYLAFIFTANTGLMVASQMTTIGKAFGISENVILIAAVSFPIMNGLGRILGGVVSDKFGRGRTMSLYYSLQGFLSLALLFLGFHEASFTLIIPLIGLLWGPIFTFFPSITADFYGRENSTANYGITYTAKAWGGLLGGYIASWLAVTYADYAMPILFSAILSFAASAIVSPITLKRPKGRIDS